MQLTFLLTAILKLGPYQNYQLFRRRLSAEGAKPESNNRWKSELGHVCGYVGGYVWYLELSREPKHVAQQTRYQNVGIRNVISNTNTKYDTKM